MFSIISKISILIACREHILNGKNGDQKAAILSKLKPRPNSIEKYIEFKETQNYQTKFLLGKPLGYPKNVSANDFKNHKCY